MQWIENKTKKRSIGLFIVFSFKRIGLIKIKISQINEIANNQPLFWSIKTNFDDKKP
jgi:hypothetical protein